MKKAEINKITFEKTLDFILIKYGLMLSLEQVADLFKLTAPVFSKRLRSNTINLNYQKDGKSFVFFAADIALFLSK